MKITVITGSPRKKRTSALLADKFIEGAEKSGHDVFRFNAAFEDVSPCDGCDRSGTNGPCVYEDSMRILNPYMNWKDAGRILATGCGTGSVIERTDFPEQAYPLGKSPRFFKSGKDNLIVTDFYFFLWSVISRYAFSQSL